MKLIVADMHCGGSYDALWVMSIIEIENILLQQKINRLNEERKLNGWTI